VIQELRWVVDQESRARDYTGRVSPQLPSFTGEDDPHIVLGWFTTNQLDLGLEAADLPSLYRLLVIPDLFTRTRHHSQQRDRRWVIRHQEPSPVEQVH